MKVFAGTYQGTLLTLQGYPDNLYVVGTRHVSENSIRSMDIDKQDLLIGGYDQEIKCFNVKNQDQVKEEKQSTGIINKICRISQNLFAIGLDNGLVRIWDSQKWALKRQLKQHKKSVNDIKVDKRGLLMLTAAGQELIFWNLQTLKSLYHYKFDYTIEQMLLSENFQYMYILQSMNIRKISTDENKQITKITIQQKIQCGLIFLNYLIVATEKGNIKIWNMESLTFCISFEAHNSRIKDMKNCSVEGSDYLITADINGIISVWDVLQFIKQVDNLSQNYPLEGLKPIHSINTKQRIISIALYQLHQPKHPKNLQSKLEYQSKLEQKSQIKMQSKKQKGKKLKKVDQKRSSNKSSDENNSAKHIDKKKKIFKSIKQKRGKK